MTGIAIYSIGMTLLHSLWQILIVFLLLRLLLFVFRNHSSHLRYNIALMGILSIVIISVATFSFYYHNEKDGAAYVSSLIDNVRNGTYIIPEELNLETSEAAGIKAYLPYLVFLYMAGVMFLSLKLAFSLLYLRKFSRKGALKPHKDLSECFNTLLEKFNIRRPVKLIESYLAKAPMVIGYLKPIVVVPVGIFTQLPFNQVEALLAHELAHIKRNDFLLNIIQSVVELLFFYHPVIYLISRHIREERENCCDDIALSFCSDSTQYVKALASMEGVLPVNAYPAVAFVENKHHLLNRMKRILNPKKMKTKLSDRIIAGIIIVTGFAVLLVSGAATLNNFSGEHNEPIEQEYISSIDQEQKVRTSPARDTVFDYDGDHIVTHRKNKKGEKESIEMKFDNGEIALLKIDGKVIPEKDYKKHKELIYEIREDVAKASKGIEEAEEELDKIDEEELDREIEAALREAKSINKEELQRELAKARKEIEKIDHEEIRREVEIAMAEAEREMERAYNEDVNWDSIRREVRIAMEEVDWEEINRSIEEAMEEANLSGEEMEEVMASIETAMSAIDWGLIQESAYMGIEAARVAMEAFDWDLIGESIEMSLEITEDAMENVAKEMEKSFTELDEIEDVDVKAEIRDARVEVKKEKKKIQELDKNMEKALEELEKK